MSLSSYSGGWPYPIWHLLYYQHNSWPVLVSFIILMSFVIPDLTNGITVI